MEVGQQQFGLMESTTAITPYQLARRTHRDGDSQVRRKEV
jgi:hypothetical protein